MSVIRTFQDVELELRKVQSSLDLLRSKDLDLSGRRVRNASPSEHGKDYVIRDEVLGLIGNLSSIGLPGPAGPKGDPGEVGLPVVDTTEIVMGNVDNTKRIRFEVDGLTTNSLRIYSTPDIDTMLSGLAVVDQIFTKRNIFQQPTGATVPALVVKNEGSAVAGDIFQVQKTDGTAIFKVINQADPGAGSANSIVSEHHYPRLDTTYDLGASINYWRQLFISDIQIGSDIVPAFGSVPATIFFINRNNGASFALNAEHLDAGTTLYANFTSHIIPSSSVAKDFGVITPVVRRWRSIYAQLGDFKQIVGATQAALVVKNDGAAVAGDVFQVQKTDGTAIFKVINEADPGAGAANSIVSEHHYARLDNTHDLGASIDYWRKLYVNEIGMSNDKKQFWKDSGGTERPCLWLDATNDFNVGVQAAAAGGGGDLVLWAQGQAFLELDQTAADLAVLRIIAGRTVDIGESTNPIQYVTCQSLSLRNVGGVGGSIDIYSPDGLDFITIRYPNSGTGYTIFLPINQGSANTFLKNDGSGNLTWDTSGGVSPPFTDSNSLIKGSVDDTKLLRFEIDGFTTGTTRVLTAQNNDYTIAGINIAQTFSVTQTFSAVLAIVGLSDNFYDIGESATLWKTIFSRIGSFGRASSITGQINLYNSGSASTFTLDTETVGGVYGFRINSFLYPSADNSISLGNGSSRIFNTGYFQNIELGRSASIYGSLILFHGVTAGNVQLRSSNLTGSVDVECTGALYPSADNSSSLGLFTRRWSDFYSAKVRSVYSTSQSFFVGDGPNLNLDFYDSVGTLEGRISTSAGYGQLALQNGAVEKVFLDAASTPEIRLDGSRVVSTRKSAVTAPTGGSTIDAEARTAINDIIARLKVTGGHGLIAD